MTTNDTPTTPPPEGTTEPRHPMPGWAGLARAAGWTAADRPSPPVPAAEDDAVLDRATDAAMHQARGYPSNGTERDHWRGVARAALDAAGVPALHETITYLRNTQAAYSAALARANAREAEVRQQVADLRGRIEAWIRHGESVPSDVTTYDRWIVHSELRAALAGDTTEAGPEGPFDLPMSDADAARIERVMTGRPTPDAREDRDDEPTAAEWREGYAAQREALQAMHTALLTIWRALVPGTEHSTYGDDPQVVVDRVLADLPGWPGQVSAETVNPLIALAEDIEFVHGFSERWKPPARVNDQYRAEKERVEAIHAKWRVERDGFTVPLAGINFYPGTAESMRHLAEHYAVTDTTEGGAS